MELQTLLYDLYNPIALGANVWIVIWADDTIVYISPMLATLTGRAAEAWLGQPVEALLRPPASATSEVIWRLALPAATVTIAPLSLLGKELALATFSPHDRAEVDPDLQRALEVRMLQSQKMESLGLLAGGIAHDFKNLLIGVIANAQFARDALRHDPKQRAVIDALGDVLLAGHRADELVHQMLTYAARSSDNATPQAMNPLADEVLALLRSVLQSKVTIHKELAADLPPVLGDSAQLSQLILNLLLNASEAHEGHGNLWLRTGSCVLDAAGLGGAIAGAAEPIPGLYAFVEVEDDGVGIAPEQLSRVFDPFYTNKANGRGLGLSVVLTAARVQGGVIFLDSAPGRGTRIRVALPALSQAVLPSRAIKSDVFEGLPPTARRRHVVVVDDEPVVRSLAQRIFDRYKLPVFICSSGPEFLDLLAAHHEQIALVLLDFSMPGMSGLEVLAALRPEHPDLPVFLSSGFESAFMSQIEDDPNTSFISKPYTPTGLMRQLQPVLERTGI
jgi:two-component system, cell cycle sensor histidine kinase and response regulator CckA